jgi:DNA-binding MarR family transcriptional regulator
MPPALRRRVAPVCCLRFTRAKAAMAPAHRPRPAVPPPPAQRVLILEDFLPYRLNVLSARVSHAFARLYSERFGISIPQWRVVAVLGQHGTLTSKEVGVRTHMHKTMVSRAVTDLERRDLLARQPNQADKREAFLTLTATGRGIYGEIVPLAHDYAARLAADLTEADRAAFERILAMLHERSATLFASGHGQGA